MGDFRDYYTGKVQAPVLTIFIGGNHEASNHHWQLYHGGWVAPNIYFLGFSGVVRFGPLRIGGISGIYNDAHYRLGYYERPPYNPSTMRSIYHFRELEILKLAQIKGKLDIFVSHEWPRGIYRYGNVEQLLCKKPYFRQDIAKNDLGSVPLEQLLHRIKPRRWFAAHMHCHFEAIVQHHEGGHELFTEFMALDKCLPNRHFLEIVDIEVEEPSIETTSFKLTYDPEWLAIIRATNPLMGFNRMPIVLPNGQLDLTPERFYIDNLLAKDKDALIIPTEHCFVPEDCLISNKQTNRFCELLGVDNYLMKSLALTPNAAHNSLQKTTNETNPEEISLDI